MGWIGKLFGTDTALEVGAKAVGEATTGLIKGIDAAFYTKQENIQDIKEVLISLQDQYTPRSISRRLLAVWFAFLFGAFCITALVFACLGKTIVVNSLIDAATAFHLGWIMTTIIIFYFGYYGVGKFFDAKNKET